MIARECGADPGSRARRRDCGVRVRRDRPSRTRHRGQGSDCSARSRAGRSGLPRGRRSRGPRATGGSHGSPQGRHGARRAAPAGAGRISPVTRNHVSARSPAHSNPTLPSRIPSSAGLTMQTLPPHAQIESSGLRDFERSGARAELYQPMGLQRPASFEDQAGLAQLRGSDGVCAPEHAPDAKVTRPGDGRLIASGHSDQWARVVVARFVWYFTIWIATELVGGANVRSRAGAASNYLESFADLEVAHLPKRPDLLRLRQRVPVGLRLALPLGTALRPLRRERRQSTRDEWRTFRHFGPLKMAWLSHAPGTIRTCGLCLRRAALYPLSYGRGRRSLQGPMARPCRPRAAGGYRSRRFRPTTVAASTTAT